MARAKVPLSRQAQPAHSKQASPMNTITIQDIEEETEAVFDWPQGSRLVVIADTDEEGEVVLTVGLERTGMQAVALKMGGLEWWINE